MYVCEYSVEKEGEEGNGEEEEEEEGCEMEVSEEDVGCLFVEPWWCGRGGGWMVMVNLEAEFSVRRVIVE